MNIRGKITLSVFIIISFFVISIMILIFTGSRILELKNLMENSNLALASMFKTVYYSSSFLDAIENKYIIHEKWIAASKELDQYLGNISASKAKKLLNKRLIKQIESSVNLWVRIKQDIEQVSALFIEVSDSELSELLKLVSINDAFTQGKVKTSAGMFASKLAKIQRGTNNVELYGDSFIETLEQLGKDIKSQSKKKIDSVIIISFLIPILVMIFSFFYVIHFSKNISSRITIIEELMAHVKDRDFTVRSKFTTKDEVGFLGNHINNVLDNLRDFFKILKSTSNSVAELKDSLVTGTNESASALNEIASNIMSIKKRIEILNDNINTSTSSVMHVGQSIADLTGNIDRQYRSVTDTTSSIEEMASSIQAVAKLSEERRSKAEDLIRIVRKGGEKVDATNDIVKSISKEVNQILDVIEIINSISEQTNILSMNAAIESAHAGEAGKGFAVVSEEIRKLAESTSENARLVSDRLKSITDKIAEAIVASDSGAKSFENINADVGDFVSAMQEISNSMDELAIAGNEILKATTSVSEITDRIKTNSGEMQTKAVLIEDSMRSIKQVSEEVNHGIIEIDLGTREILTALTDISALTEKSRERMEQLDEIVGQFKLE